MTWGIVAIAGSTLVGGLIAGSSADKQANASTQGAQLQADASERAAQIQADAANRAVDIQNNQFEETRGDYAPWRTAGQGALTRQSDLLGLNGADPQTNAFSAFRTDPGYEFTRDQAVQGVDRSAAARGLLTSGRTIKAIQDRAASLADQGFGNYFNRLAGVAGTGQTATNSTATAGANAANNEGNALISGANARASGINTGANALANGYAGAANAYANGANGIGSSINSGLNNYFAYKGFGGGSGGGGQSYDPSNVDLFGGV